MIRKHGLTFVLVTLGVAAITWYGCSDHTVKNIVSADEWPAETGESYFLPLEQGFTVIYEVTRADGSSNMITLEMGKMVQMGAIMAYEWFSDDGSTRDTGYIAAGVDAAYFYESANSEAEKMIELPPAVGDSWERFSEEYGGEDWVDILSGQTDGDDEQDAQDDAIAKVLPSEGGNIMTVVAIEDVQLSNGQQFNGAVKICNESSAQGKVNYYWYVNRIGLVKYMLGVSEGSNPRIEVTGELLEYGR